MEEINLRKYSEFVYSITSNESKDTASFLARFNELDTSEVNIPLLITAGFGLGSEGGEFQELVKKILFQGKPLNGDNIFHLYRELGDIIFYWVNACRALNLDPNSVIAENVKKLEARYPGGKFDPFYSENRKTGDI